MLQRPLSLLFLLLFSQHLLAAPLQIGVKGGTWNFVTENVRSTNNSASGVGAYTFEIGYSILPKWMLSFGFNLIMSDIYRGGSGYGFDVGGKYFPLTLSSSSQHESEYSTLTVHEVWRPYLGLFMRQRLFGLAVSTSYVGPGLSAGVDYSLSQSLLISAEFRYDYLYGSGDALAKQTNILFGVGFEF